MKSKPKEVTLRALQNYRGDNLYRCRSMFRGLTAEQMQLEHGQSGKTRAAILAEYEQHDAEVSAALEWVKALKP